MRIGSTALVLLTTGVLAGTAQADNGASFDFGYVRSRVAVTDATTLEGQAPRFGLRIARGRYFHFGAECEEATLSGSTREYGGALARTSDDTYPTSPLEGNSLELKMFAGAHVRAGAVMLGADLAGGLRDSWVSGDQGIDVGGRKNEALVEARSRADVFLSPSMTLGGVASVDLIDKRNMSLAAVFSLYFSR